MKQHIRIKYIEGREVKQIMEDVGGFNDAVDLLNKFTAEVDEGEIVVLEVHMFYS